MKVVNVGSKVTFPPYIVKRNNLPIQDYYVVDKLEIVYYPNKKDCFVAYEIEGKLFTRDCFYLLKLEEEL